MASRRTSRFVAAAGSALVAIYAFEAARYKRAAAKGFDLLDPPVPGTPKFGRFSEALTGTPVRDGNRIQILRNGDEIFPAMLEAISGAEKTIAFETYLYWKGDIGERFAEALTERAAAGVQVSCLLDGVGAMKIDRALISTMEQAGAHVAWFRPPRYYTLNKLNHRTHRRVLAVDGYIGFTGGIGIADEWCGDAEDPDHWRETQVRIEGPATRDLLGAFWEHWTEATEQMLSGTHFPDVKIFDDGVPVHITPSSVTKGGATELEKLFYAAIVSARQRIWLTTGYFVPRQAFVDALCAAVARGIDVKILVNGPYSHREVARQAGHTSFGELLRGGVRIFEYQQTYLHAKTLVVDDSWASIGTNNFNNRSLALNDEITLSTSDEAVATELANHFLDDLAVSNELDRGGWSDRSPAKRALELVTALAKREL
ncbi:MAG: phospholipase D-like domain-containing protein [Pseudonocardiaceae bacterium]